MNWKDVLIHAVVACLVVPLLVMLSGNLLLALAANTVFWPARELLQHRDNPLHVLNGAQSRAEWVAPVIAGAFTGISI